MEVRPRASEPGHNARALAPSRMTSRLSWIASLIKKEVSTRLAPASDAHSAAGRPARKIAGLVAAGICGTPSTREECARIVSTSGLQRSVCLVSGGRRIRIGMLSRTHGVAPDDRNSLETPAQSTKASAFGSISITPICFHNY